MAWTVDVAKLRGFGRLAMVEKDRDDARVALKDADKFGAAVSGMPDNACLDLHD